MPKAAVTVVREGLQAYANRKVFRSFTEQPAKNGTITFNFLYFGNNTVTLRFSQRDHTLVIPNMLTRVSAGMYADLQAFLNDLSDPDLPAYRRIDRSSADAQFLKKRGNVSLVLKIRRSRYQYGVDKLVNLVSWVRIYLQGHHQAYLWQVMGEPED